VVCCWTPSLTLAQEQSIVFRELIEAESLLYQGDYDEALRRVAIATEFIEPERRTNNAEFAGTDPPLLKGTIDIFKGQIYLEQGFLSDADLLMKRGRKQIEDRRTYWMQMFRRRGRQAVDVNLMKSRLLEYYMREGQASILRGEVAMEQAWIQSVERGQKPPAGTARELLEKGIFIVKDTLAQAYDAGSTSGNALYDYYDLRRTWYHARLRDIETLMEDGDIRRSRELMNALDEDVQGDFFWQITFNPHSAPSQPPPPPQANGQAAPSATPAADNESTRKASDRRTDPSLDADGDASGSRDSSRTNRMRARMSRFYSDMLEVEAEMIRREAAFLEKPGLYLKAEQKAAAGRDLAEEYCWGTPLCATALIGAAHAFLDMHRVYSAGDRLEKVFEFQGDKIDTHDQRLKSYLDDVDDLITRAGSQLESLPLSTTHPALLRLILLRERFQAVAPGRVDPADIARRKEDFFKAPLVRAFLAKDPEATVDEIVEEFERRKIEMNPKCVERVYKEVKEPNVDGSTRRRDKPWPLDPASGYGKRFVPPPRQIGKRPSLLEQEVIQVLGDVAATDSYEVSSDEKSPPDHYWRLSEAAIGKVVEYDLNLKTAIVEFASNDGWTQVKLQKDKKYYYYVNPYSGEITVLTAASNNKVKLFPERNGLLLNGESKDGALALPIRVQFPLICISLRPPKKGEVVERGPDWNKGNADGGRAGMTGRLQPWPGDGKLRNEAGYVLVKWDATERVVACRWHVRGLYDVWPISEERALEGQVKANPVEATPPAETGKESEKD
jgi:hypothetical protein